MSQYLLSVHTVEGEPAPSSEVVQEMYADVDAFNRRVQAEGAWVFAGGLEPIEAPDLDAALAWAAEGSKACRGKVEVRPFQSE